MAGKKHTRLLVVLTAIVLGMFGFGFALVPIYNTLCKSLGINGKVFQEKTLAPMTSAPQTRTVTVEFVAVKHGSIPWEFYPHITKIKIHPGEMTKLAFYAENASAHTMTVQAVPSITPGVAAKYLKKTECFCFTQQTLNGHEAMDMPLLFHLDPDLPEAVKTITLAYTLYDVTDRSSTT